ncbi:hypothetical protein CYJ66_06955 [Gardnerella vaginalis]|nr:hypothetical protein HMPREF9231_0111 [Gardnerella vaginalis HMP9231]PKZ52698.1 hypothetical protein CYJ66_06955 [Gardnerella vaginalis]PKZ55289.1 hypothetical protein CYJ64_06955 [Gardnerella vaginalis]PMC49180.1 hypothetical protein CJ212_06950 [Gardnerella vaginalis]PZO99572.1 MAG: hypothetical protein DI615_02600 [Gardnerella vaginalis]
MFEPNHALKELEMRYAISSSVKAQSNYIKLRINAVCCGDTMGYMYFFTPRRCESTQKIMYANKGQALMAADKSLRERGARLWVYKCDYCGSWHLTHSNPAIRKYCDMRSRFETTKPKSRKRGYKPRLR